MKKLKFGQYGPKDLFQFNNKDSEATSTEYALVSTFDFFRKCLPTTTRLLSVIRGFNENTKTKFVVISSSLLFEYNKQIKSLILLFTLGI